MKKNVTILIILIIIILGLIPFFLPQCINEKLTIGTSVISSLSSIVTLIIALLLYNKYGVENSLINNQAEVVFRLLRELKKIRFLISYEHDGEKGVIQLFLDALGHNYDYKYKYIALNMSYVMNLDNIWEIAEDVFLPIEIMDKIKPLMIQVMSTSTNIEREDYMLITVPPVDISEIKDEFFDKLNNKNLTLEEFINKWEGVIIESKKWLKENSSLQINLNFERI